MPSFPLETGSEKTGSLPCIVSPTGRQVPPIRFALSRLPKTNNPANNTGSGSTNSSPYASSFRSREPAKLSTVSLVGRKDKKKQEKVNDKEIEKYTNYASLEECLESRPPLKIDLSGPKPTTYDPPTYLPWETTSPSYTMRPKTQPEKDCGGDRVSWKKQWMASHDIWTYRAHFDVRCPWPSPAHYNSKPTLGGKQVSLPQSPSHSMGRKIPMVFSKEGSDSEPAPNQYDHATARLKLMRNFPSYSIQEGRKGGTTVWTAREPVPGPGTYNPRCYRTSSKPCAPCYSMSRSARDMGITRNCTL